MFYTYLKENLNQKFKIFVIKIKGDFSNTKPYSNFKESSFETIAVSPEKAISNVKNQIFKEIWKDKNIRISQTELQIRDKINRAFEFDYIED